MDEAPGRDQAAGSVRSVHSYTPLDTPLNSIAPSADEGPTPPASFPVRYVFLIIAICLAISLLCGLAFVAAAPPESMHLGTSEMTKWILLAGGILQLIMGITIGRLSALAPTKLANGSVEVAVQTSAPATSDHHHHVGRRFSIDANLWEAQRDGLDQLGILGEWMDTEEMREEANLQRQQTLAPKRDSTVMKGIRSKVSVLSQNADIGGTFSGCRQAFLSGDMHNVFDELDWNSDIAQLTDKTGGHNCILLLGLHLVEKEGLLFSIPDWMLIPDPDENKLRDRILTFLHDVEAEYKATNPYHNNVHACDVMKNMFCFLQTKFYGHLWEVREWAGLIGILAAAMHDMGHTGQTNNYHIATKSELALRYNDKSPLEQMHVSKAFELMRRKPATDWYGLFRKEQKIESKKKVMPIQSRFRRTLIAMVLGTDNLKHNESVLKLKELVEEGKAYERIQKSSEWQQFALETALHAADIANATYALPLSVAWSKRIVDEFWEQGDLERQLIGEISLPMFDRSKMDIPSGQIGFIKFIAIGLWESYVVLLPEMACHVETMKSNLVFWEERKAKGLKELPDNAELGARG